MDKKSLFSPKNLSTLVRFLEQNRSTDFLRADLLSDEVTSQLDFTSLADKKAELITNAKAYQRLLRIIPEQNREVALTLLDQGIHSALQIAKMTRRDFMGKVTGLLKDEKLADAIYKNARKKRGVILLQYMDVYQNNEPHIKAARFS